MSVQKYSTTADSNTSVGDGGDAVSIGEGMPRGDVNNAMRAIAADIAKGYKDSGGIVSTGTATALALATSSEITALSSGLSLVFRTHVAIDANATLNVNGIGARALKVNTSNSLSNLVGGEFPAGAFVHVVYDGMNFVAVNAAGVNSTILSFSSRADFLAWADDSTPTVGSVAHVWVGGQAGVLRFAYEGSGSVFVESELDGWRAVAPVYLEHYGATPTGKGQGGAPDYTAHVQAAMNATEGELIFTGFVKITDKIVCPNSCSPYCPDGREAGGFSVFSDFNMSATCVFQPGTGETASTVGDFCMWFQQPSAPANRAALNQYPPAVNIGHPAGEAAVTGDPTTFPALARGYLKSFRIEGAWDGIIGVGNCGGYRMGVIEVGCFNRNIDLYGALDFFHIESMQVWPFGFAGNSSLTDIYYDGDTIGFRARHVDGLTVDKLSVFRSKVVLGLVGRTTILPMGIDVLNLDGDKAVLRLEGETSKIGEAYSSKSASEANAAIQDVHASGGLHQIGSLKATSNADGIVLASGTADLHIDDFEVRQVAADRRAAISQGSARLSIGIARPCSDLARTNNMFVQQSGASMHIGGLAPTDSGQPAFPYVKFEADDDLNYANCPNYEVTAPASATKGTYIGRNITQKVAEATRIRKIGSGEGPEISFELAGGTPDAMTTPPNDSIVGDISFGVWDGALFNYGAYIRARLTSVNAAGNTPMSMQFMAEDVAGNIAVPMELTGDSVVINKPLSGDAFLSDIYTPQSGRVLRSGDLGLGRQRAAPNNDANQCTSPGFNYRFSTSGANCPVNNPYGASLNVYEGTSGRLIQTFLSANGKDIYTRASSQGGVNWSEWVKQLNSDSDVEIGDSNSINFTDELSETSGQLEYDHSIDKFNFKVGSNLSFEIEEGAVSCREPLVLKPIGSEGGELRIQDASGNSDFFIDVDAGNNLRIRQAGNTVVQISGSGILTTPGVLEFSSDAVAASNGIPLGGYYVDTTTGALTKRRT